MWKLPSTRRVVTVATLAAVSYLLAWTLVGFTRSVADAAERAVGATVASIAAPLVLFLLVSVAGFLQDRKWLCLAGLLATGWIGIQLSWLAMFGIQALAIESFVKLDVVNSYSVAYIVWPGVTGGASAAIGYLALFVLAFIGWRCTRIPSASLSFQIAANLFMTLGGTIMLISLIVGG